VLTYVGVGVVAALVLGQPHDHLSQNSGIVHRQYALDDDDRRDDQQARFDVGAKNHVKPFHARRL
jgi:hypothetical protein